MDFATTFYTELDFVVSQDPGVSTECFDVLCAVVTKCGSVCIISFLEGIISQPNVLFLLLSCHVTTPWYIISQREENLHNRIEV